MWILRTNWLSVSRYTVGLGIARVSRALFPVSTFCSIYMEFLQTALEDFRTQQALHDLLASIYAQALHVPREAMKK